MFVPTNTTTPTIPVIDDQVLDGINDWNLNAIVNGFYPTTDASSSSSVVVIPNTTTNTFIPSTTTTTTIIPPISEDNSQVLNVTSDWTLDAALTGFYPTIGASSSSFATVSPKTSTTIPTITTTQTESLNNSKMVDETYHSNLHVMVNGLYPTTTTLITPNDVCNSQNSSFLGEKSHHFRSMEESNIKKFMQVSNNPFNISNKDKPPLTNKNWPILSLPGLGRLPESSNRQPQQLNQFQGRQQSLHIFEGTSKSNKREKDMKRIYKMPPQGLNTDVWSWKKYAEKFVKGSPYARNYYKCGSKDDCNAERRVERNRSDPDSLILTYTGHHNHPMPFMKYASDNKRNNTSSSETLPPASTEPSKKMKKNKDDDIFEGLGNFVDL